MIWEKYHIWRKNLNWRKGQIWQEDQNWQKYQIWEENQIWEKYQIWERCKISDISYTSPPASYSVDLVSNFCWTKKKFWKTKSRKLWLWNSSNCDLDDKLATWGKYFSCNAAGGSHSQQFFSIHIFNKSIFHVSTAMPQSGQNCST